MMLGPVYMFDVYEKRGGGREGEGVERESRRDLHMWCELFDVYRKGRGEGRGRVT